jgi:hypothetical protein
VEKLFLHRELQGSGLWWVSNIISLTFSVVILPYSSPKILISSRRLIVLKLIHAPTAHTNAPCNTRLLRDNNSSKAAVDATIVGAFSRETLFRSAQPFARSISYRRHRLSFHPYAATCLSDADISLPKHFVDLDGYLLFPAPSMVILRWRMIFWW